MTEPIHAFSYGGGVQSTAALVLAAQGQIPPRLFIFANVGDDSENPATVDYVREVAQPYASAHGIELVTVRYTRRDGTPETLLQRLDRTEKTLGIPVRMAPDGAPGRRACTGDFKIKPMAKELKRRGATAQQPAQLYVGISWDEWQRMRNDSGFAWVQLCYPLVDLQLDRAACIHIIEAAGLAVPDKSACWFCPFHRLSEFQTMRHDKPALFAKAVALEQRLNARRAALGKDAVYLSRVCKPLDQATSPYQQGGLFTQEDDDAACSGVVCMI